MMKSTKEYILDSIRAARPGGEHPYPAIPVFPKNQGPILDEFKRSLEEAGGSWREVKDASHASLLINEMFPQAKVICSAASEISGNKDITSVSDPHGLDDVDVGVARAQFGVSETGMVWLREEDLKVNALGVLSQHLVILLDPSRIVRDMYEAYAQIRLDMDNYGCFMMGPSATADIGAVMVRGAQGARSLTVFFM